MSLLYAPLAFLKLNSPSTVKGSSSPAPLTARRQPRSIRCEAANSTVGNPILGEQGGLVSTDEPVTTNTVSTAEQGGLVSTDEPVTINTVSRPRPSPSPSSSIVPIIARSNFPAGFTFGASTAALQIEGALHEGGRGPSIWEEMISKYPWKIHDGSTPAVACDSYHRYKDDVELLKKAGMDAYRFSISWSRILPKGSLAGGISMKGIQYYNNLIDELLAKGIEPYVTLFHWDVPQSLENLYCGFLSEKIVEDFKDFAGVCFASFGDRVKHWITVNEPHMFISKGYDEGSAAPARCSDSLNCPDGGDSATEPYRAAHNMILAHATAVRLYKEKFQHYQKGIIGITLDVTWYMPYSKRDIGAQQRVLDFEYGWYMDPLVFGDYPSIMREIVGERLPTFTEEQTKLVRGSYDFVGLNYYTSSYVIGLELPSSPDYSGASYSEDSSVFRTAERDGDPIGEPTKLTGFYSVPQGIFDLLLYTKQKYKSPTIYITENGCFELDEAGSPISEALQDKDRTQYYASHLAKVLEAIRSGVKVKGYFAWSLMDNWEWTNGYSLRLGITYMDSNDGQKRYQKDSFKWFIKFLRA